MDLSIAQSKVKRHEIKGVQDLSRLHRLPLQVDSPSMHSSTPILAGSSLSRPGSPHNPGSTSQPLLSNLSQEKGRPRFYERSIQAIQQQNQQLKDKIQRLEGENQRLKKSIYWITSQNTQNSLDSFASPLEIKKQGFAEKKSSEKRFPYRLKAEVALHQGAVYCTRFSPSGKLIASGSLDKSVRISQVSESEALEGISLPKHALHITDICWSSSDSQLLVSSFDGKARLLELRSGTSVEPICTFFSSTDIITDPCICITMADDSFDQSPIRNLCILGSSKGNILGYDKRSDSGKAFFQLKNSSRVNGLMLGTPGEQSDTSLYSADADGNLKLWDLRNLSDPCTIVNLFSSKGARGICSRGSFLGVHSTDEEFHLFQNTRPGLTESALSIGSLNRVMVCQIPKCHGIGYTCSLWENHEAGSLYLSAGSMENSNSSVLQPYVFHVDIENQNIQKLAMFADVSSSTNVRTPFRISSSTSRIYSTEFDISGNLVCGTSNSTVQIWSYESL